MKAKICILILVIATGFASCKKDNVATLYPRNNNSNNTLTDYRTLVAGNYSGYTVHYYGGYNGYSWYTFSDTTQTTLEISLDSINSDEIILGAGGPHIKYYENDSSLCADTISPPHTVNSGGYFTPNSSQIHLHYQYSTILESFHYNTMIYNFVKQ